MKKIMVVALGLAAFGFVSTAQAASKMVGTWGWKDFTLVATECEATGICVKVTAGPKNVGMEMIKSKLEAKGDHWTGKVAHPMTGETYNSKITMKDDNNFHMAGCTDANVCAEGTFTRK